MKKSLVMASLIMASTSSMMAMDLQYFLGAGAERGTLDFKASVDIPGIGSDSLSDDESDTALKLKAGIILNKTHRISLSHVKYNNNGADVRIVLGNYDYLIPINNEFRVYAGLHAGQAKYEQQVETIVGDHNIDMSGLVYGTQIGAIYDITKNVEFELGFAYSKYNVDETSNKNFLGLDYTIKTELENSTAMFAGINYKF